MPAIAGACFGAKLDTFPQCSGYGQVGYSCNEGECAVTGCVGLCHICAVSLASYFAVALVVLKSGQVRLVSHIMRTQAVLYYCVQYVKPKIQPRSRIPTQDELAKPEEEEVDKAEKLDKESEAQI